MGRIAPFFIGSWMKRVPSSFFCSVIGYQAWILKELYDKGVNFMMHRVSEVTSMMWQEVQQFVASHRFYRVMRYVSLGVVMLVALWLGSVGFRWYTVRRDMAAQYTFAQAMEQYAKVHDTAATEEQWAEVAAVFKLGYEQHRSSAYAPYFLNFQAQALLNQGKYQEAITVLDSALALIPTTSPLFAPYAVKKALILLDSDDQAVQEKGLTSLTEYAHDVKNKQRDEALYYLGLYYAQKGDVAQARAQWGLLVQVFPMQGETGSVYAELAQARLDHMV